VGTCGQPGIFQPERIAATGCELGSRDDADAQQGQDKMRTIP
jgi:hypothetical protein